MPSKSTAQREVTAIAEHHPEELKGKNRGLLKMSHQQLHEFASTKEKGLPEHVKSKGKKKRSAPAEHRGHKTKTYQPHNAIGEH